MIMGVGTTFPLAPEMTASAPVESKLCEWGCGRTFLRPVPLMARDGQKVCKQCLAMSPRQREQQYEQERIRDMRARHGVM
jgi:hypothetical protein